MEVGGAGAGLLLILQEKISGRRPERLGSVRRQAAEPGGAGERVPRAGTCAPPRSSFHGSL